MRATLKAVGHKGASKLRGEPLQAAYDQVTTEAASVPRKGGAKPLTTRAAGSGKRNATSSLVNALDQGEDEEDTEELGEDQGEESDEEGLTEEQAKEQGTASKPIAAVVPGTNKLKVWDGSEFEDIDAGEMAVILAEECNRPLECGVLPRFCKCTPAALKAFAGEINMMEEWGPQRSESRSESSAESIATMLGQVQESITFPVADERAAQEQYALLEGNQRELTFEERRARAKATRTKSSVHGCMIVSRAVAAADKHN